jgi:lipopolysaccharide transport system ATP-binding protein
MYKIFPSRGANLLDALGLPGPHRYREFWALRGIDFQLERGRRLGIVGRNGAGKSTLLKLITGNIVPTEGSLEVRGDVQALIEAGAGFHPEFTGEENIRAALTLQGIAPSAMQAHVEEISAFTELGEFLAQPFRTYSSGMQARLAFATATAVEPEILIVDEMLSAGDAYFSSKASERMRGLVDGGATLLLVSHSLDQVTMFCDEAIWIDRGRIVKRGSSLEVVKAYQQFTRMLDERRLKAKNRKVWAGTVPSHELDNYADSLEVRLSLHADDPGTLEIDAVRLRRDGDLEEHVAVGDAQDADTAHAAFVALENSGWSSPVETDRGLARRLPADGTVGCVVFNLYAFFAESEYKIEVDARGEGRLRVELIRSGSPAVQADEPLQESWSTHTLALQPERAQVAAVGAAVREEDYDLPSRSRGRRTTEAPSSAQLDVGAAVPAESRSNGAGAVRHWPGEGTLTIEQVALLGPAGEQAVFEVGVPLTVSMGVKAHAADAFRIVPAIVVYRLDGVRVSSHVGPTEDIELERDEQVQIRMHWQRLNLGNGHYVVSAAIYRNLTQLEATETYDLVDRSYEFEVVGNDPLRDGIFQHPADWIMP